MKKPHDNKLRPAFSDRQLRILDLVTTGLIAFAVAATIIYASKL